MIYIIEDHVLFNMDENAFTLLEDSTQKIIISNPACRVLALLIENHGSIVLRETLFQKVWDDYGLISSNNNLNQCISKLRKIIDNLGITSEFIVTIPKIGFLIKKETKVQVYLEDETLKIPDKKSLVLEESTPEAVLVEKLPTPAPVISKKNPWSMTKPLAAYLIISLMICLMSIYVIAHVSKKPISLNHFVANVGECKLYSTIPVPVNDNEEMIGQAKSFIAENNIVCKSNNLILFQAESELFPIDTGSLRVFMAKCEVDKDNRIESCLSYYKNDRKSDE